ncbi:hypothetical protein [Novosphingobium sp. KN65.2]|uniref:hypothetical protein n=1 Tax=Novosphingobium sp. KN65.2 TaxID=1478134 RepID=UPI000A88BB3C|nr:hypothetical protein [Novosphingobium sp. KN65.2]
MSLQFDPRTGKITYKGKEVGEHIFKDGRSAVRLNIEYEGGDDWIVPLSWFAHGLSALAENQPTPALLTVDTPEDSIAEIFEVVRYLTEKQVKRGGYIWKFHKSDVDNWPSPLHGHDYDKGLKLDAITGDIYDVGTKERCKTLKAGALRHVQAELRSSKDFKEAVASLIDDAATNSRPA